MKVEEDSNNVIEINRPAVTEEILRTRYSAPVKLPSQGFILFLSSIFGFARNDYDLFQPPEAIPDLQCTSRPLSYENDCPRKTKNVL